MIAEMLPISEVLDSEIEDIPREILDRMSREDAQRLGSTLDFLAEVYVDDIMSIKRNQGITPGQALEYYAQ